MLLQRMIQDLRYAMRQLRKSPGFTLTAVLTLALGIGAMTTVATWTNAVLYNPWPHVNAPRELRFVSATVLGGRGYSLHYNQYRYVHEQEHSFSDAIAFAFTPVSMSAEGMQPQAISAGLVSSNYFQFLGLKPEAGRFFQVSGDDRDYGAHDEIVLSDSEWRERFGADPKIVGRTVSINRHAFTVAGIAPAEFTGIFGGLAESAWIPLSSLRSLSADPEPDPLSHYGLQVAARLRPGVTDAAAATELHMLARTFALQQHTGNYNGWDLNLNDAAHFERGLSGALGEQLPVLFGASFLLMLLVCINIASLLGQHAARRRREVAIRTALGATPGRIAVQTLVETGLLAALGGLAGWAASTAMSKALYVLLPNFGIPLAFNLHSDLRVLAFVATLVIVVTLACGLWPVRQSLRVSQKDALHEGGTTVTGGSRKKIGRHILLGLQLGISFIVLVCCGLMTRTALNTLNHDKGFDSTNCITAHLALSRSGYNKEKGLVLQSALLEKLRTTPGVTGATLTTHLPMGDEGSGNTQALAIPGYVPSKSEDMEVVTDFEGPDFFHTMGIAMRQGREFGQNDSAGSPDVAVVNESMARRYWPNGDAIGHTVVVGKRSRLIVGVVHDYAYHDPQMTDALPLLFLPLAQDYSSDVIVAVHSRMSASAVATQLRQAVASMDGALPLENVRTLQDVIGEQYQMLQIPAELLGVYALACILVAMLGLYAVMAYSVIERHREFALRMAMGSTRASIFQLVLSGSAMTAALGLLIGGLGSAAAARLLRAMLFGVTPFDPISYCAAAALLLLTVFVAGLAPARRAASVEPMQALRSE